MPVDKSREEADFRSAGWKLEWQIYENARRFAKLASGGLQERANAEDRMFALVHVMIAIELLLKSRISHHDGRLLKKGKALSLSELQAGKFFSLSVEDAVSVLEKECGVHLSSSQRATISSLCADRNSIVHLHGVKDDRALVVPIADGLSFFIEFVFRECPYDHMYQDDAREMAIDWTQYPKFCEQRNTSLQEHLKSMARPRTWYTAECNHCTQPADVLEDGKLVCLFCRSSESVGDYAAWRSEDGTSAECPDCHQKSVMAVSVRDEIARECFCCGCLVGGPEPEWANGPRLRPL